MSERPAIRFWARPRRDAAERARYALLIEAPANPTAVLAYGDAEDTATPMVSIYRVRRNDESLADVERRLASNGYLPAERERAPVAWLDARGSIGRRNLARIGEAASGDAASVSLEAAGRAATGRDATIGELAVGNDLVSLLRSEYGSGRTAVIARDEHGPYGVLSLNAPDADLPEGCIAVKTWSENSALARAAAEAGFFEPTGKTIKVGISVAPIWRIL